MSHEKEIGHALYSYRCLRRLGISSVVRHIKKRNPLVMSPAILFSIEKQGVAPSDLQVAYLATAYGVKREDVYQTAKELASSRN